MKRVLFVFVILLAAGQAYSQATSATATNLTAENYLDTPPTLATYCLQAATGQTSTTCTSNLTDVYWFKFTLPTTITSCAVKITVVPAAFDATVDFYDPSLVFKQCVNAAGSAGTEYLRTNPNTPDFNVVTTGSTYYFRVASTTDVTGNCFQIGLEYYPAAQLNASYSPNPPADSGLPGFKANETLVRTLINPYESLVQATRWRFVDTATPTAAGCVYEFTGTYPIMTIRDASCVCYGHSYRVYIQYKMDGIYTGECLYKVINMESEPTATISTPTCSIISPAGSIAASYIAANQVLQWEFSLNGVVYATITGAVGSNLCYLSQVNCLLYGRIYQVRVRVQYCSTYGSWSAPWCLITPPFPYTQINNCGQTLSPFSTITCTSIPGANQYVWQIAQVNPAQPTVPIAPASVRITSNIYLTLSSSVASGRTYRAAVKGGIQGCPVVQQGEYGTFCNISTTGSALVADDSNQGEISIDDTNLRELDQNLIAAVYTSEREFVLYVQDQAIEGNGLIQIYNISGQLVHQTNVSGIVANTPIQIELPSDLASDLYIYLLHTESGSYSNKFLYQN